jgi:hypothetical protein
MQKCWGWGCVASKSDSVARRVAPMRGPSRILEFNPPARRGTLAGWHILARSLREGGIPQLSGVVGLGFHVGAEDGVDAGLVAFAVLFEPLHDVVVDADGEAVFGFRQGELGGGPERFAELGDEKSISESRRARRRLRSVAPLEREREVVCVGFSFIAMCPPG